MVANRFFNSAQYISTIETLIEHCRSVITDFTTEQLWLFSLNNQGQITDSMLLGKGNLTGVTALPEEILSCATSWQAKTIILAHTHPSDNLIPSTADTNLTEQIYLMCLNADLKLQDHLIIGKTDYFSFAQSGILYNIQHRNNK